MANVNLNATVDYTEFEAIIEAYKQVCSNMKPAFQAVLAYWHKWNETYIFGLAGPGKYEDLSPDYASYKEDHAVQESAYPILKFSGVLEASITTDDSPYSVAEIGEDSLVMGTTAESIKGAPYALFLQLGTSRMPARPPIIKTQDQIDKLADTFLESMMQEIERTV